MEATDFVDSLGVETLQGMNAMQRGHLLLQKYNAGILNLKQYVFACDYLRKAL